MIAMICLRVAAFLSHKLINVIAFNPCSSVSSNLGSHLRDVRLRVDCVRAAIMVKVQVRENGSNGQHRAEFWGHGRIHKSGNQDTRELADAIKDKLDAAATHEERLEILAEVQAQKAEAVAQESLEATRAAREKLLSKLRLRKHRGGWGVVLSLTPKTYGPVRNGAGLLDGEKKARAEEDLHRVRGAAWDGMAASDLEQLVNALKPEKVVSTRPAANEPPRKRQSAQEKREKHAGMRGLVDAGKVSKGAEVMNMESWALLLFMLWVGDASDTPKEKLAKQCLAQVVILCYIYGSRLEEVYDLPAHWLDQGALEFQTLNYKKAHLKKEGHIPREHLYKACVFPAERPHWAKIWKFLGLDNLDQPLLFTGAQHGPRQCKWGRPDDVVSELKAQMDKLGVQFYSFNGTLAHITGHSIRRSRGVHLLQHCSPAFSVAISDLQEMYHHDSPDDTTAYVQIGRSMLSLKGEEPDFKKGVLGLLCARLEAHCGNSIPDPCRLKAHFGNQGEQMEQRSGANPRGAPGDIAASSSTCTTPTKKRNVGNMTSADGNASTEFATARKRRRS